MAGRAQERMNTSAAGLVEAEAASGYGGVSRAGGSLRAELCAKYLLFPVYMFDILHGDKQYHFAVNGQTGKVVGELPIDKSVSRRYFLVRAGIVAGAIMLVSILRYMMGWW